MTKRVLRFWFPVIAWALIIFFFSSLPKIETSEVYWQDFVIKKLAHLTEYFIFFILLYRAIKNSSSLSDRRVFILSLIILVIFAISDEFHQSFTPSREPRIRDIIIDGTGGLIGLWFLKYKLPKAPARLKNWAKNWQIF